MPDFVLRSLGQTFSSGHVLEPHSHPWGQLIYFDDTEGNRVGAMKYD